MQTKVWGGGGTKKHERCLELRKRAGGIRMIVRLTRYLRAGVWGMQTLGQDISLGSFSLLSLEIVTRQCYENIYF